MLDHYSYTYDRAGNRTSRDNELHSAFDEDYTYDDLDRLTDADRADAFDQSWGLDGLGNFGSFDDDGSSQTRTVNGANEIQGITGGWITPAYDAAGNMTSGPAPGDGMTRVHYVYDAWNRLVAVKADDSGEPGNTLAEYEYDGTKRRVEKTVTAEGGGPSHVHYFYNHDWQVLEEVFVDGQGETSASNEYAWSPRYIDAPITRFHDANGDGDHLDPGDTTRYYTGDANYNVTATIDAATGDIVERYVYTAYGQATVYDQNWSNPAAPTTDSPLYCGYFFDAETALYQVRNRYYDSNISTFISKDPTEYHGNDANLYRYVHNQPLGFVDPYGLEAQFPYRPGVPPFDKWPDPRYNPPTLPVADPPPTVSTPRPKIGELVVNSDIPGPFGSLNVHISYNAESCEIGWIDKHYVGFTGIGGNIGSIGVGSFAEATVTAIAEEETWEYPDPDKDCAHCKATQCAIHTTVSWYVNVVIMPTNIVRVDKFKHVIKKNVECGLAGNAE